MKFGFLETLLLINEKEVKETFFIQYVSRHSCLIAHIDHSNKVVEKIVPEASLQRKSDKMISYHEQEKVLKYFKGIDF